MNDILKNIDKKTIRIKTDVCLYCGCEFGDFNRRTREHVVGRRFVPVNSLEVDWNLIVDSCENCNNRKSILENDISAITMYPDHFGNFPDSDPAYVAEARRKLRGAISPHTGKPVSESMERFEFSHAPAPGLKLSFRGSGFPHIEDSRAFELAKYHVLATQNFVLRESGFEIPRALPGSFCPIAALRWTDWGNQQAIKFQNLIESWDIRFIGITASDFFKIKIKRLNSDKDLWAWAVEWNKGLRVFGFFGDYRRTLKAVAAVSKEKATPMRTDEGEIIFSRIEKRIGKENDTLFDLPDSIFDE